MTILPQPGPTGPTTGGGGTPTPDGGGGTADDDGGVDTGPTSPPPSTPPTGPTPQIPQCGAKWQWTVAHPDPSLEEKQTTLTLLLFRTDTWAFVCSAYCRSESTWYVDWFASTAIDGEGGAGISIGLSLENACPNCRPNIDLTGLSQLLAKAQVKSRWGSVDPGTAADAAATTIWGGPLDCSASCSARARPESAGSTLSIGTETAKYEGTVATGYSFDQVQGGKGDTKSVQQHQVTLLVSDRAAISTNAGGTECNAQAKANVGYKLDIRATGSCGDTALLVLDIVER
jgi:hypothetical protein